MWELDMEKRISGHTRLLALIGSPVSHSGSPAMYNYSFQKHGLDYAYVAFDVKEDGVKEALNAMRLFNMRGMNVTMPDKVEAAKYMDELSPAAQLIGAVNTIVKNKDEEVSSCDILYTDDLEKYNNYGFYNVIILLVISLILVVIFKKAKDSVNTESFNIF